jgi:hypothetical protein
MTSPAEILRDAAEIIEQRGDLHGDWRTNCKTTAILWSRYAGYSITPSQVGIMNCLQKISRMISGGQKNQDDFIDLVGWAAIAAALAANEEASKK